MNRSIARYGWKADPPDGRDHRFSATPDAITSASPVIDLCGALMPPVYDQDSLGACAPNEIASALQYDERKQGIPDAVPSRLFIYYNARDIEGDTSADNGICIRDGVKAVATLGYCPEDMWPYVIGKYDQKPPPEAYAQAVNHRALAYRRVDQDLSQIKAALAQGFPIIFGMAVYESFESEQMERTGVMSMPSPGEKIVGYHCVLLVGCNDPAQQGKCRNSWGEEWGQGGYFTMPYGMLLGASYCSDFWIISSID